MAYEKRALDAASENVQTRLKCLLKTDFNTMISHYLKITLRTLSKQKGSTFINITGLAIGLSCFMLIAFFVADELSFDTFHKKSDRIFVAAREYQSGDELNRTMISPLPLGEALKNDLPEVDETVITNFITNGSVSTDGIEFFKEDRVYHATDAFFKVFDFPLLAGDPATLLSEPGSVVLSASMAKKYFPGKNPLGQTITIDRQGVYTYTITGVAKDPPENSFLRFDFLASIFTLENAVQNRDSWGVNSYWVFTLLGEGRTAETVEQKLDYISDTYLSAGRTDRYFLAPLSQLYLSDLVEVEGFKGDMKYIYIFSAIGLFILILAIINYMNLATAQSLRRATEVGIRKVSGADFKQLMVQYLTESLVIALFGFLASLFIAELLLNFFNSFFDKNLVLISSSNLPFLVGMMGVSALAGILAGLYPAFYLSAFKPIWTLKGQPHNPLTGVNLRKVLVVAQFSIAIVLITGTLVMMNQLEFILEKDPGYNKEQVMVIEGGYDSDQTLLDFKEISIGHSAVTSASIASGVPGQFYYSMGQAFDPANEENEFRAYLLRTDPDYADVLGIEMVAGRYFSEQRPSDAADVCMINEAFLGKLGWGTPEEALGRRLNCGEVIGVVRNFHFQSLHSEIAPVFIVPGNLDWDRMLAIKFEAADVSGLINYLEEEWKSAGISHLPLSYNFLDSQFALMHQTDKKMSRAFGLFAGIAIFIACLGLFGLAAYAAERRKKEIGIRKILGATLSNILNLLTTDFLKLVVIGFLVAAPVAWIIMQQWLQQFAYRIEIGAGVFVIAGLAAMLIAFATVSYQSVKAALTNPVNSIRSE